MARTWTLLPLLLLGCAELASVERLRCGNGLHELQADEDCDGLPPGSPLTCGTPGSAAACRFTCVDDDECPTGWTCGDDGICRVGSGAFAEPTISPLAGEQIAIGDVDGDGHDDVVAQSTASIEVAYGTGTGEIGEIRSQLLSSPRTAPAVGDIDDDGYADIATYGLGGPVVHRGRPDRHLFPVPTPNGRPEGEPVLALGVRATPPYDTRQLLTVRRTAEGLAARLAGQTVTMDGVASLRGEGELVPHVAVGDLDGGADVIALGLVGGSAIEIVRIACSRAGTDCALTSVHTVPGLPSAILSERIFLADLDGDGDLDLIAQFESRGVVIAASLYDPDTGFGPFDPAPGLQPAARMGPTAPVLHIIADIVGDARADMVTDQELFEQVGEGSTFAQVDRITSGRPAQLVLSADVDGDARSDLVVVDESGINLLTFDDADRSVRTAFPLGGIGGAAVGDFDADGLDEVIAHQYGDGTLFMTTDEGITPIGVVEPVPTHLAAGGVDATRGAIEPATLFAVATDIRFTLEGREVGLPYTPMRVGGVPRIILAGRLLDGEPALLVGNQQMNGGGQLLGLRGAALGVSRLEQLVDGCGVGGRTGAISTLVPGVAGGPGAILELSTGFTSDIREFAPDDPFAQAESGEIRRWALRRFQVVDGETRCDLTASASAALAPVDLESVDIDGDGRRDIVALLIERVDTGSNVRRTAASALAIWRETADGFPDEATIVALPAATTAMAVLHLGDVDALVLAGADGLQTAAWGADGLELTAIGDAPARVQALAAADIDGDGLDDLVIKTIDAVRIARQPACTARAMWEGRCLRAAP